MNFTRCLWGTSKRVHRQLSPGYFISNSRNLIRSTRSPVHCIACANRHKQLNHQSKQTITNWSSTWKQARLSSLSDHAHTPRSVPSTQSVGPDHRAYSKQALPEMEPVDAGKIKEFLTESEMVHKQGHTCLITTCPRLTKRRMKLDDVDKLYINMTTGEFKLKFRSVDMY